jgi:hypothetical protein
MNYSANTKYQAQDFELSIPSAFQDRSVNVFLLGKKQATDFNLVASRDILPANMTLDVVIKKQLDSIASAQKNFSITQPTRELLLNNSQITVAGSFEVEIQFKNQATMVYQRHAFIELDAKKLLLFVATVTQKWNEEDNGIWVRLMQNLKLRNL